MRRLLKEGLQNREGRRAAVIMNDMSEINIDVVLVERAGAQLSRTEETLVEMTNGCICCTLREDLLAEVSQLPQEGRFDYLLIESTGISKPIPVAQPFTLEDEGGVSLSDISRLDTMVTVVDAASFLPDLNAAEALQDRDESIGEADEPTVTDLFVDQVEFADLIVLNRVDLVTDDHVSEVEPILRALTPGDKIIRATRGRVPLDTALDTGLFAYDATESSRGGTRELSMGSTSPRARSTAFRAPDTGPPGPSTPRSSGPALTTRTTGAASSRERLLLARGRPQRRLRVGPGRRGTHGPSDGDVVDRHPARTADSIGR